MLLYPTADYTKFENYFVTKNENFFRDYRNDANRDIKEALDRHTQGLPENPEDIKWLEIEMDRQNGQRYSLSQPKEFIELAEEIKELKEK